ncbi:MAG: hypothetical protein CMD44_02550 [Gammaproteobacteria bacterium]|jgi:hypothetical protein|nr:hypothetical protein [Gammaproteobacteria bacterium]|tara:strand:- start:576 stop:965 length:390 start_codon:yes stop_codon:yes gene_type:complete
MNEEFKWCGLTVEKLSVYYGVFLISWGFVISFISGSDSFTSYIPSVLGLIVFLFSVLAIKIPNQKKLFMHLVVLFGVVIFLGGLDVLRSLDNLFDNYWADLSKLMLLVTGFCFTVINVKSFIFIRKNKN